MLELIPGLNGLLDYFAKNRQHRDGQADLALLAIYTAANETKIYLAKLERSRRRNPKAEIELSRLWGRAAIPVRRFDRDLADRCLLKSDYWIRPERWTAADIEEKRIGISAIFERTRDLIRTS